MSCAFEVLAQNPSAASALAKGEVEAEHRRRPVTSGRLARFARFAGMSDRDVNAATPKRRN